MRRSGEFFRLTVPRWASVRALRATSDLETAPKLVLALKPSKETSLELRSYGAIPIIPFPFGSQALAELLVDGAKYPQRSDDQEVYIPRAIFDEIADDLGAKRIVDLPLRVGMASRDPVTKALNECLAALHESGKEQFAAIAERMANCLNVHLAEHYGKMRLPPGKETGLAPWQLRYATRALRDFNTRCSLDEVAEACGLSVGQFSRAFKRRTGSSPHQWVMHRRIEAAQILIGWTDLTLAEIALSCCFSDQSHLTRVFTRSTGVTPGRWRLESAPNALASIN